MPFRSITGGCRGSFTTGWLLVLPHLHISKSSLGGKKEDDANGMVDPLLRPRFIKHPKNDDDDGVGNDNGRLRWPRRRSMTH